MTAAATLRQQIDARRAAIEGGLSINELSRRAGTGNGTLKTFLAGGSDSLSLDVIERVAPALNCTVFDLLGAPKGGARSLLHPDQLHKSPLNPRKKSALGKDDIADLAKSIAEMGVLQNLVARPSLSQPGLFEIAAGERRWRAACYAVAQEWVAPDFTVPVVVREITDAELIELALVENIKRDAMHPLEEADALAKLQELAKGEDGRDWTKRLAERTGKGERWIQKRVRLNRDLDGAARKLLADDRISTQMAIELSELPKPAQAFAARALAKDEWHHVTAENVRSEVLRRLPEVSQALFDIASYKGEIITTKDGHSKTETQRFADRDQALALQAAKLKAMKAEFRKTHSFVQEVKGYFGGYEYTAAPKDAKPGADGRLPFGVVIQLGHHDPFDLKIHDRLVPRAGSNAAKATAKKKAKNAPETPAEKEKRRKAIRRGWRGQFGKELVVGFERQPIGALRALIFTSTCAIDSLSTSHIDGRLDFRWNSQGNAKAAAVKLFGGDQDKMASNDKKIRLPAIAAYGEAILAAKAETLYAALALLANPHRQPNDREKIYAMKPTAQDAILARMAGVDLPPALQHELEGGDILKFSDPAGQTPEEDDDDADDGAEDAGEGGEWDEDKFAEAVDDAMDGDA